MAMHAGSPKDASGRQLSNSASAPELWPESAAPGGPWVLRNSALTSAGRTVARPPKNEAAAIAWKAARKATLHGQLGTGNRVSSVVQYPVSSADPHNMCQRRKNHLTAEERRILRLRVKHHMKGRPAYPDSVYTVERHLLKGFAASPELCEAFYATEGFAEQLLREAAVAVEHGSSGSTMRAVAGLGSTAPEQPAFTRPGQHGEFCGPQCYCLKFQDAPLHSKTRVPDGEWRDSFAQKTKMAAAMVVDSVAMHSTKTGTMVKG